jgi:hypothetical protein
MQWLPTFENVATSRRGRKHLADYENTHEVVEQLNQAFDEQEPKSHPEFRMTNNISVGIYRTLRLPRNQRHKSNLVTFL